MGCKKRMRNVLLCLCVMLAAVAVLFPASAAESTSIGEEIGQQLEASGAAGLYGDLPEETQKLMEELGLTLPDYNKLNQITPLGIFQTITSIITGTAVNPLRIGILILGVLLLSAVLSSLLGGDSRQKEMVSLCVCAFLITVFIPSVWNCLTSACSAIVSVCDFSLVYIPVLTALAASSGSVSAAAAYNAMLLGLSQALSQFAKTFLMPCAGIFIGLGVAGSLNRLFDFSQLTQAIRKVVTLALTFCGTIFTALITTKGAIAKGVDTVALKGAKFVVGAFVPVVGSSMSDAVGSIMSGLSVVKNSVGIFSIIAVALILAPIVIEMLLWILCLNLCAGAAGVLGEDNPGKLLKGIADGLSLINTVLIFCLILFVVSTAIILTIKAEFS